VVRQASDRLVVQVLRVVRLGEEEPALRQQSKVLHQKCRKQQAGSLCSEAYGQQQQWRREYQHQENPFDKFEFTG